MVVEGEPPQDPHQETSEEFQRRRKEQIIRQMEDEELERLFDMKQDEIRAAKDQGIISHHIFEDRRWDTEFAYLFKKHLPFKQMPPLFGERLKRMVLGEVAGTLTGQKSPEVTPPSDPQQPEEPKTPDTPSTPDDPNTPTE